MGRMQAVFPTAFSPHPLPHHFLVQPWFSFHMAVSLTQPTIKKEKKLQYAGQPNMGRECVTKSLKCPCGKLVTQVRGIVKQGCNESNKIPLFCIAAGSCIALLGSMVKKMLLIMYPKFTFLDQVQFPYTLFQKLPWVRLVKGLVTLSCQQLHSNRLKFTKLLTQF